MTDKLTLKCEPKENPFELVRQTVGNVIYNSLKIKAMLWRNSRNSKIDIDLKNNLVSILPYNEPEATFGGDLDRCLN